MRSTVHLVTDRDCLALRPPVQEVSVRGMKSNWGKNLRGVDFDLPDGPRPDPGTPAPVRFLYDFDNLLLSHEDRTRFLDAEHRKLVWPGKNRVLGAVLVDGAVRGSWSLQARRDEAALLVRSLRPLASRDRDAVTEEGLRLLAFLAAARAGVMSSSRPQAERVSGAHPTAETAVDTEPDG